MTKIVDVRVAVLKKTPLPSGASLKDQIFTEFVIIIFIKQGKTRRKNTYREQISALPELRCHRFNALLAGLVHDMHGLSSAKYRYRYFRLLSHFCFCPIQKFTD